MISEGKERKFYFIWFFREVFFEELVFEFRFEKIKKKLYDSRGWSGEKGGILIKEKSKCINFKKCIYGV